MEDPNQLPSPLPLVQMITGFWVSKTLAAAVELDIFTRLSDVGATVQQFSQMLAIQTRPAEMLLTGCASLGLLVKKEERYYNSPLSSHFLVKGKPYYFGDGIAMMDKRLYLPWNGLTKAIRTNKPWRENEGIFKSMASNPEEQRIFTEAMYSWSILSGKSLAEVFDFTSKRQLLDVGGGSGAYCIEVARRYSHLHAVVFDLPSALRIAEEKITEAGLSDRIKVCPGDFFAQELPDGSDVILLSMILHDWTAEKNLRILKKCFEALPSGGTVIVSELMTDDDKTGPVPAALMSLNMLIETEGQNYTWSEYTQWLKDTGFKNIQRIHIESPGANGLLIGHKP